MKNSVSGGRPRTFTEDYITEVFNDFILNNPDSNITPSALTKWSEHQKWRIKWDNGEVKPIPRYVWYKEHWKSKIEEYNNLPFILRTTEIEKATPFNINKIVELYGNSKGKLKKYLEKFEQRANIALKIASEVPSLQKELDRLFRENIKLKEKNKELVEKLSFFKKQYEELIFDSNSLEARVAKNIIGNVLSIRERNIEDVKDELKIESVAKKLNTDLTENFNQDIINFLNEE